MIVVDAGVVERLVHREIGIGQLHVLAHERDVDLSRERRGVRDELVPLGHVGLGRTQAESRSMTISSSPCSREFQRHLVDAAGILCRDDRLGIHVAEQRDLAADARIDRTVRARRR